MKPLHHSFWCRLLLKIDSRRLFPSVAFTSVLPIPHVSFGRNFQNTRNDGIESLNFAATLGPHESSKPSSNLAALFLSLAVPAHLGESLIQYFSIHPLTHAFERRRFNCRPIASELSTRKPLMSFDCCCNMFISRLDKVAFLCVRLQPLKADWGRC